MTAVTVALPTLHADQVRGYKTMRGERYQAWRCGRRYGKTTVGVTIGADDVVKGYPVGWFAPDYKKLKEPFDQFQDILRPVIKKKNENAGLIQCVTGGSVEFWTLNDVNAGRSRKYRTVLIDEAAFGKRDIMMEVWRRSIKPTLLDYAPKSRAIVLSNSAGMDPDNFFYQICTDPQFGFKEYHAPTRANPLMSAEELIKLEANEHPLVWKQEYEAEFVDWSGVAFFDITKMMDLDGQPVSIPAHCDTVFATIDTATKTGKENDGTAVCYWARTYPGFGPHQLILLDWDIQQIEGSLLETWLRTVFQNLEHFAQRCRARAGSVGAWIEDKSSGMVLLQQAQRRNWPASPIDSKLTSVGKVERCLSVSGYVHRGLVKICKEAHDKVVTYKGATRNHLEAQVLAFRVDDKDPMRADDGLDAWVYGVAIALGNNEGF